MSDVTLRESERAAYQRGDTEMAAAYGEALLLSYMKRASFEFNLLLGKSPQEALNIAKED